MTISGILAYILCVESVDMDLRDTKVDNHWLLLFLFLGGLQRIREIIVIAEGSPPLQGTAGHLLLTTFAGMVIPLMCLIPFWIFGMIGAGDIKLLSVLGLYLTSDSIIDCLFFTFLFGAFFSILSFLISGNFFRRIQYFLNYIDQYIRTGELVSYRRPGFQEESLHMTVPVTMAVLLWIGGAYS